MDTLDELERLLAEADLDTLSVETVPTSIGCCHKIMPIEACLYADNDRIGIDENNPAFRRRLARAKVLALGVNALPALLAVARAAEVVNAIDDPRSVMDEMWRLDDALARLRGAE